MLESFKNFILEKECLYKNEHYSVRDNGAVFRHSQVNKRKRSADNQWTFGKLNIKTGYLEIGSVRVHRIVATAFHGKQPSKEHIVDHIDTNRQNNRPENLRWITRLENVLLNPITAKRIALVCGSVEEFLANPSIFRDKFPEPNLSWMCSVSIEDAQISKNRLLAWAENDKIPTGHPLSDWVYKRKNTPDEVGGKGQMGKETQQFKLNNPNEIITDSLTPNAVQNNWKTPAEFPCCPKDISNNPIVDYSLNLKQGVIFSQNQYSKSIIDIFALSTDKNTLWIICKNDDADAIKPYLLAEVLFENGLFIHRNLGSFFDRVGAERLFVIKQGLEWCGGQTFDEFC